MKKQEKNTEFQELLIFEIHNIFRDMITDMYAGTSGNKKAQQRARVATIKLRDKFREYRELTTRKV